ncbi:TPA: hypothetical protein RQP16_002313 [Klebsiella michiganensis]|uniref:hypothetical protein n=1 Tax=Klebsiella michiganensis TaxID=1134687 RepID=UPI0004682F41|nr:hypothetical protein [Klebsiella michiganensis]EKQ6536091.1 hypothetical protein [Klebsiella michiganensis]ELQ7988134.1 hypothetical protein [Klebsiella michiganensis]MBZ7916848.1 hypothetical protein [Klebsiella michiganensis]MCW9597308.1 hypothetical protein [Klebsiella michiganensis]HDX9238809.1 hypothetical protein [Klebsiella michiganensis]
MINTTLNTVGTLLNSFHSTWHMPTLQLVNNAWQDRTPEALLEAVRHTGQAVTSLEHLERSVARLAEREGSTITPEEAWYIANEIEELECSLLQIVTELGSLAIEIAEECELA